MNYIIFYPFTHLSLSNLLYFNRSKELEFSGNKRPTAPPLPSADIKMETVDAKGDITEIQAVDDEVLPLC